MPIYGLYVGHSFRSTSSARDLVPPFVTLVSFVLRDEPSVLLSMKEIGAATEKRIGMSGPGADHRLAFSPARAKRDAPQSLKTKEARHDQNPH